LSLDFSQEVPFSSTRCPDDKWHGEARIKQSIKTLLAFSIFFFKRAVLLRCFLKQSKPSLVLRLMLLYNFNRIIFSHFTKIKFPIKKRGLMALSFPFFYSENMGGCNITTNSYPLRMFCTGVQRHWDEKLLWKAAQSMFFKNLLERQFLRQMYRAP
jgi:hypothetical protein